MAATGAKEFGAELGSGRADVVMESSAVDPVADGGGDVWAVGKQTSLWSTAVLAEIVFSAILVRSRCLQNDGVDLWLAVFSALRQVGG